jgi:hypothetical protein
VPDRQVAPRIPSQTLPNVLPEPVVPFGSVQAVNWAQIGCERLKGA